MLRLLGTPFAERLGTSDVPLPARAFVLIALLRLEHGGRAKRAELAASLWEDDDDLHAHASLRQLLSAIRRWERCTGSRLVDAGFDFVAIHDRAEPTDLDLFLSIEKISSGADLESLLTIYRGELLHGISGLGSSLEQWVREQEVAIGERFAHLAITGAEVIGGSIAEAALRRVAAERPYDDGACRALMRFLATNYSHEEAIGAFETFHRRLFDDLHTLPASETIEYARALHGRTHANVKSQLVAGSGIAARTSDVPRVLILRPHRPDKGQSLTLTERLASALIEDVTLNLCRQREFAIIAPYTAAQIDMLSGADITAYHVEYVVATKLQRAGHQFCSLEVQLLRTASGEILWFDRLPLQTADGAEHFQETGRWLAVIVSSGIRQAELRALREAPDTGSYRHYLMGRRHLEELSLQGVRRARKWFRSAHAIDNKFAPALSWLAHSYVLEYMIYSHGTEELLHNAAAAARQAIEVDPLDENGHRALGRASLFLGRLDESLDCFVSAEHFAPHQADLLADYADTLMHNSEPREAKRRIAEALELNPLAPDVYQWIAGGISFFNDEPAEGLAHLKKMKNPDQAMRLMAACAAKIGNVHEAVIYRKRALEIDPDFNIRTWTSRLPLKQQSHLDSYVDALRAAGFV